MIAAPARLCLAIASLSLPASGGGIPLPDPEAPEARVLGEPGGVPACYWVFAEGPDPTPGPPSHYVGAIRGRATALSPPARVALPRDLGRGGKVVVRVRPVPGAVRYYVLKTSPMTAPSASVNVGRRGEGMLYYWVVAANAWRRSAMGGPFLAEGTDPDEPENTIEVAPVTDATGYSYFVTRTPEPPVGRDYYGVAEFVGPKVTHRGGAAHVPAGFPPTPETEPPSAFGLFLLAATDGAPVEDAGQPLRRILPPSVNETRAAPLVVPPGGVGSARNPLNALLSVRPTAPTRLAPEPSFAWSGFYPLWSETTVESGGINHYQNPPAGGGNYKSTIGTASLGLTGRTASQYANLTGYMTTYGMGDSVWLAPQVSVYGGMRDQGDEGTEILRSQVDRMAKESWMTLKADAPRRGVALPVDGDLGEAGAGRLLVNASQSYRRGRIERVDNCTARGLGTDWMPEMVGRWISFDVDSAPEPGRGPWSGTHPSGGGGPGGGVRQWYQIDRVAGPTELGFRAITSWSAHCNLGFSRFICDRRTGQGPAATYTSRLANHSLPSDRLAASEAGGYLIAPGTALNDPCRREATLLVEPLREAWRAGDRLVLSAGPQTTITHGWFVQFGRAMPQDVVQGLEVMNFGDRTANGAGLHVGANPDSPGWQVGIQVTVPNNGHGDGIAINGSRVRSAAILVPAGVPALRFEGTAAPFLQGDPRTDSLELRTPDGAVPARFQASGTTLRGQTTVEGELRLAADAVLAGSPMSRGKAVLSGDGATSAFTIRFPRPYGSKPVVYFKTNLFLRDALREVTREGFTAAFESPPPKGEKNIVVWWMAQE